MSSIKTEKAPPGAKRLIESLRDLGYDTKTAIADLVDNSVAADASSVQIEVVPKSANAPAHIVIMDNGKGMSSDELRTAMRYASDQEYDLDSLGKYGLGLKTASLSQCGILTVISKPRKKENKRSTLSIARWDVEAVCNSDEWDLQRPELSQLENWERGAIEQFDISEGGTIVIWSKVEKLLKVLDSKDAKRAEGEAARLIAETSEHLGMVFHRFLSDGASSKQKLKAVVGGIPVEAWDPFCKDEDTKQLPSEDFDLTAISGPFEGRKYKVTFRPFVLPPKSDFSSPEAFKRASGPAGWNNQQGFYFYRNDRLVQAGGWSNIRSNDEHGKSLRVAVFFKTPLDDLFSINITKMRARIPVEIRESVKNHLTKWNKSAESRYRKKSPSSSKPLRGGGRAAKTTAKAPPSVFQGAISMVPSNTDSAHITVANGGRPGQFRLVIPEAHVCYGVFNATGSSAELKKLCYTLFGILESVVHGDIKPKNVPLESLRKKVKEV